MAGDSLQGKKVVVIGGTSGIGFAVARAARDEGATVVVASSNAANVDAAVGRLGEGAQGSPMDVTNETAVAGFFAHLGPFDHLVHTAGDWGGPARRAVPPAEWDLTALGTLFTVRFWGALRAIKFAHQHLSPAGSITLTDGTVSYRPRKGAPVATAMAGAIEHLTRGLAVDLAPLRVNAVCPGIVRTEIWDRTAPEQLLQMTAVQLVPRPGEPAEVAEAYLYLMRGGYTTGQVLYVDGGTALVGAGR